MTIDLALDDLPIAAVATHDATRAELDELRRAVALDAVVGVCEITAGDIAASGPSNASASQASAIVEWLLRQPVDRLCALAEQPLLRVWLADAPRRAAIESADKSADESAGGLGEASGGALAWLLLSSLHEMAPPGTEWMVDVPGRARRAPLESDHYLLSGDGSGRATTRAVVDAATVRLDDAHGRAAQFARTSSGRLALREPCDYPARARRFPFLDIELLDDESFPELRRTSPGAAPCPLGLDEVGARLAAAFALLMDVWPESVPHVLACFRGVIAIDAPPGHVYSASVQELPLILQLTIRADDTPLLLAETIVHETAHVKLDSLLAMAVLAENEDDEGYHHPWRADPRPLRGVMLGAHAFANVALLYERAAAAGVDGTDAARQRDRWRSEVDEAMTTLDRHARFTPAGRALFDRLADAIAP